MTLCISELELLLSPDISRGVYSRTAFIASFVVFPAAAYYPRAATDY